MEIGEGGGSVMGLGCGGDDNSTVDTFKGRLSKGADRLGHTATLRTSVTPQSSGWRSPSTKFHLV